MLGTCIPRKLVTKKEVIKEHTSDECCTEYVSYNFAGDEEGAKNTSVTFLHRIYRFQNVFPLTLSSASPNLSQIEILMFNIPIGVCVNFHMTQLRKKVPVTTLMGVASTELIYYIRLHLMVDCGFTIHLLYLHASYAHILLHFYLILYIYKTVYFNPL
jgi:hypothetical protein